MALALLAAVLGGGIVLGYAFGARNVSGTVESRTDLTGSRTEATNLFAPTRQLERFSRRLNLTDEQRIKVKAIFQATRDAQRDVRQQAQKNISEILNEKQRSKYERMLNRRRSRHELRRKRKRKKQERDRLRND